MAVKPIPDGYHAVTPYLVVRDVNKQLEFFEKALGAKVLFKMDGPNGPTHAEVQIRDSRVMVGMAHERTQPSAAMFYLYVDDCDAAYKKAVDNGAESVAEPETKFYGDRSGAVKDASGNEWWFSTHVEDVSEEQLKERAQNAYANKK
jgi:PhnB protein